MGDTLHLNILTQGVRVWDRWRLENREIEPDLSGANLKNVRLRHVNFRSVNLSNANLTGANLFRADLRNADLSGTNLKGADLTGCFLGGTNLNHADLREVNLTWADLRRASLLGANLVEATLTEAILREADLSKADLSGAKLYGTHLVRTNLSNANLTGCSIYGISAWGLELQGANQVDLIITPEEEPIITVDDLEVAQFIYLLLNSKKIRNVIETISKKAVLILGRFTPERKVVLDAIRDKLRHYDYLPILFDFEKPDSRDLTETVSTLAHISRFIIADITDAKSIPQELQRIVPDLPSVPVQPIMQALSNEYGMFEHFRRYPWVLQAFHYRNTQDLLDSLDKSVIAPLEQMVRSSQT